MPFDATHEDQGLLNTIRVRDFLAKLPPYAAFNMGTWGTETTGQECGSPACIAGWTCFVIDGHVPTIGEDIQDRASVLLGLNLEEADLLFLPELDADAEDDVELAVRVLDQRIATGVIDWAIL